MSDPRMPGGMGGPPPVRMPGGPPPARMPGGPPGGMPGGPSPGGPPVDAEGMKGQLKGMRSLFNPQDVVMMVQDGEIGGETTVIQLMAKLMEKSGVDPNGPISQLGEMFKRQMRNADPVSKMRQLAQRAGPGGGPPGMGGPPAPGANRLPQGRKPAAGGPNFGNMFGG